ncbi:MAG TPA: LysR family transcriptional regulator [Candidatus Acidoferrales bacterium]|jgi:LysR family transcriptional regulator, low CO2-responsive transcriptional regulator|nr:LysR family transcriptional regulator [Candidatus Acidoferrales bacterium]
MDTDRFKIFLECARLKNFSRAAEVLHLSQPSISLHIRQLEEWCGTNLFQRRGRRVELTDAGQLLKQHAQRVLTDLGMARQDVQELLSLGRGRLAVAGAGLPGTYMLPKALSMFKAQYPKLEINMNFGTSSQVEQSLQEDVVELAMFSRKPKVAGLKYESYASSAMVTAVPPGHRLTRKNRVTLKDLAREPLILREPEAAGGELVRSYFARKGLKINAAMELSSHEAIKVAVAEGFGIAIIARRWLANELALKMISTVDVSDLKLSIDHGIIYREGRVISQAAKTFLQFLRDEKAELAKALV